MLKTSSGGRNGQNGQSALVGLEKRLTGRDPDDSVIPSPVRRSVRLMLSGAALTLVSGLFWLIVTLADKAAITNSSSGQISNSQFAGSVVEYLLIEFLIPMGIWILMARFNRGGRTWARIVASVLCAIDTYLTYGLINSLKGGVTLTVADIVYIVLTVATWIVGVIAIAMIWRGESSVYFRARSARQ